MPAISLDKLKLQSANLAMLFNTPDLFVDNLREILDLYSDRTRRGPQKIQTNKYIPSYHVSDRVVWQILHDLQIRLQTASYEEAILLAEILWESPSMEEKSLAIKLLGEIPYDDPGRWLKTFQSWVTPGLELFLLSQLVDEGLNYLRKNHFDLWLILIKQWLSNKDQIYTTQAILALKNFILEDGDRHLPAILEMLSVLLLRLPKEIHPEVLQLIGAMVAVSPIEMRYFMRELLTSRENLSRENQKLIRNMIDEYPEPDRLEFKRQLFVRKKD